MKHEPAMQLVAALRSGNYRQTKGKLLKKRLKDNFHCCLGVACDISKLGNWRGEEYFARDYSSGVSLTVPMQQWLGVKSGEVTIPPGLRPPRKDSERRSCSTLAVMNDSGYTFAEIADFIEQHWERLT